MTTSTKYLHPPSTGYVSILRNNLRLLSFGVLLTLFSSFGQTFLISIFVPLFLESFSLNTAQFGSLYAAATLTAASCLPYFGRLLDRVPLRRFCPAIGLGLAASCLTLALAPNVALLFGAIVGLRLTGQGLMSLTASTTMARFFARDRGRALSVTGIGYPLGEGLLPLGVVILIHAVGWRVSWGVLGAVVILLLLPVMSWLLRHVPDRSTDSPESAVPTPSNPGLLRDWRFYALLPSSLFLPLVLTALFLYQVPLAEARGWTMTTMATAFIGFAAARLAGSLLIGPLIDRCSALRLFPFVVLPVFAGLVALSLGSAKWVALIYLTLAGVSQGISGPTMTALWAEVFGTRSLGATKGTVATMGVLATAVGPILLGVLLAWGVPFHFIIPCCAGLAFAVILVGMIVRWRLAATSGQLPAVRGGVCRPQRAQLIRLLTMDHTTH